MTFQRDRIRENRVVYPGTDHRIALLNVKFNTVPVTELHDSEAIAYTIFNPDNTVYMTGNAVYGLIDNSERNLYGWYAFIHIPNTIGTLHIIWRVNIEAAIQTWTEKINVIPIV